MKVTWYFLVILWTVHSLAACSGNSSVGAVNVSDAPQKLPNFSGQWMLNAKASDDPQKAVKNAMQAMKSPMSGRGGGQGMGGGRGMGRGQHKQEISHDNYLRGEMYQQILPLIDAEGVLSINHQEPVVLVGNGSKQKRIFTDFRGSSISLSGGDQQRVMVAGWEGTMLVVETTLNSGVRLIQNYRIDAKTGQLKIDHTIQLIQGKPVSYQLVYERKNNEPVQQ